MKFKYIIGVLVLLLLMVGTASAEQIVLTEENSNIVVNEGYTLPEGLFEVTVTYNPSTGQIVYQYTGNTAWDGTNPYITNPKIDEIGYNLDRNALVTSTGIAISPGIWADATGNSKLDGFGAFLRDYTIDGSNSDRIPTVTVQLEGPTPYPQFPSEGYAVGLHLAFDGAYDANNNPINIPGHITLGDGSSYFAGGITEVPEFPTIALPIAALLGLMFIFGRRKQ